MLDPILNDLEKQIFNLYYGNLDISDFEQWVYESSDLETLLSSDDYLELISLNYRSNLIYDKITHIVSKYLDYGKLETIKIVDLLNKALNKGDDTSYVLRAFYDMYCDGYYFLKDLGLGFGLACTVPPSRYSADTWEDLSDKDKKELINSFYPRIVDDIKRVLVWIENKDIILTGTKDDDNRWEYIDNRTPEEKSSTIGIEPEGRPNHKKWWEFWRK